MLETQIEMSGKIPKQPDVILAKLLGYGLLWHTDFLPANGLEPPASMKGVYPISHFIQAQIPFTVDNPPVQVYIIKIRLYPEEVRQRHDFVYFTCLYQDPAQ